MAVEFVELTVQVPKEINDIRVLVVELVADIKAKKGVTELVSENLSNLINAVEGFEKLGEEVKTKEAYDAFALTGTGIAKALLK